jgi:hypothetical protein
MTLRRLFGLAAVLLAAVLARPLAAQSADIIRGRVVGPDSLPVEGVQVTATSVSGGVNRTARTNRDGRFTITFPAGDGDYFVGFSKLGFAFKRFEVKRTADQDILVADTKLQYTAQRLDEVTVRGERSRVNRNDNPPDISGTERPTNPAALTADQMGDLAAMAATLPGVLLVPGVDGDPSGFSVLGLTPDQNNTTLNGLNFGGSNLPRDAGVSTSLVTTPYDVSRGGFSGAQFNVRSRPGSNYKNRTLSLNVDAPSMQWTDPAARSLGQQYTNLSLGGAVGGPITYDKAFYNLSYQLGRRSNDLQTLANTSELGLQTSGVAFDSVQRFLGILGQEGVPATVGGLPSDRLTDNGSIFGSIDFMPPSSTTGQAFNVTMNGSWNRQRPVSTDLTRELLAHSGESNRWNGGVQARHTNYYGFVFSETSIGVSGAHSYTSPFLSMPSGSVRVNSNFADGSNGVKLIGFGGSSSLSTSQSTLSAGLTNQLSWFSFDNKHRLKLTTELRRDSYSQDQTTNRLGSFSFNSLEDLEAGRPSTYTRQLSPRLRSGDQWVGGISLGDSYRPTRDLQLQYGVRIDGNHFGATPTYNPQVEQVFGQRNDEVPNRFYISPRIGFSWTYGTAPQIAGFEGAVRGPRAVVRGGIGVFQNLPGQQLIGGAIDNTGLPSAVQQITCVGAAAPIPDWDLFRNDPTAIPSTCADGTSGTVFANAAPNVTMFAPDYAAQKSIRSNLQWNGPILGNRFSATIDGTYSLNLNQPGFVDLNFNPVARFSLANEGGRPVFAQPTSIVPATGAIAPGVARVSTQFSRVMQNRSDLKGESRQISLRLSPTTFSTRFTWGLSYVYSNVRERVRGFSSTVGNPLDVEWGRAAFDSRHQITYNVGYNFLDAIRVNWSGSFRSGLPFTPTVAGDINGDGYVNDRAYIFDPSTVADPALAAQMQSLIASASDGARSCLVSQMGRLAGRNSCHGPWTTSGVLSFSFNPLKVRMPQRANISFQVANPLAAADMLVHPDDQLRGWGQTRTPDQSLLFVRGFEPQTQRFKYEVNQRFGSTRLTQITNRAPVSLTAMVRMDIGPAREWQQLTLQLDRGRKLQGNKVPEGMMKAMYGGGSVPNPMATILRQSDTLKLSGKQADSIATMNRWYTIRLDSIWTPVARHFAELPNDYDRRDVYDRYRTARKASIDLLIKLAPSINGLLTPAQRRLLPSFISGYLDPRYLAAIRSGTQGAAMPFGFPGGGFDFGPAIAAPGGATVIIR